MIKKRKQTKNRFTKKDKTQNEHAEKTKSYKNQTKKNIKIQKSKRTKKQETKKRCDLPKLGRTFFGKQIGIGKRSFCEVLRKILYFRIWDGFCVCVIMDWPQLGCVLRFLGDTVDQNDD